MDNKHLSYDREQGEGVSAAICREFSGPDGKVRIDTTEKAKRLEDILRERGYKAIQGKPAQNEPLNRENEA